MSVYPILFGTDYELTYSEEHKMSLVLHGTLGEFSYNVVTNGFDNVQVQFDIPEDHPLFGLNEEDPLDFYEGDIIPFSGLKTVVDEDGTTTWAMCDIPVEDCLITLTCAERELLSGMMWLRVSLAALAAYEWLKMTSRKNYIADNGKDDVKAY